MRGKRNKICLYDKLKINMKKILLFLICFLAILIIPKTSYSAVPTEIPSPTTIYTPPELNTIVSEKDYVPGKGIPYPGFNCGDSTSEKINRCCYNSLVDSKQALLKTIFPEFPPKIAPLITLSTLVNPVENLMTWGLKKFLPDFRQAYVDPCLVGSPSDLKNPSECICIDKPDDPIHTLIPLCNNIESYEESKACVDCFNGRGDQDVGVWTAVGCIYTNPKSFIEETVFRWGIGLAGTIALFCIIYSAFQIQISQGNPEKLKKAQEMLTSCIVGLMLIIFSIFILKVIGVDILRIPF